jgi:hypothetical protein
VHGGWIDNKSRVVCAWTTVVKGGTQKIELLLQRPDTNAQDQSSVADYVQGAVTLSDFSSGWWYARTSSFVVIRIRWVRAAM